MKTTLEILSEASEHGYAVGAFNIFNIESAQAVARAAASSASPVIVQITENTLKYAGGEAVVEAVKRIIRDELGERWPAALHLDHGKSLRILEYCLELGFTSVMFDGSRLPYEENLAETRKAAEMAHARGASLQAELGSVFYAAETEKEGRSVDEDMTDPEQAARFVAETGCDTLAVAIGNAHGFLRERSEPDFERLSAIGEKVKVPLVLHGASDWGVDRAKEAIRRGITCFNVDTASRVAFTAALSAYFYNDPTAEARPRHYLALARDAMTQVVEKKMDIYGSVNRVSLKANACGEREERSEA
ncbi:MAG TPA: ketose-bisphosphate aldolase [Candidatus Moranbacteria bacterium]|nr:ketose-bisphosphate aldolase [Candidatus Moranbacteria bacterium]